MATRPRRRQEFQTHPHARHPGHPEEQRVQRPQERGDHADADEGVHGGAAVPSIDPGRAMEGQRAPNGDGRREGQREPLPVVELQGRDHRQEQHGQREGGRDEQALAKGIRF